MGIQHQQTRIKSKILSLCQILIFIAQKSNRVKMSFPLKTIDPHPMPSSTNKIKDGHCSTRADWIIHSEENKRVLGHDKTSWLIGLGLSDCPSEQVRAKMVCCKSLTTLLLDQWMFNNQDSILAPYGSPARANRWLQGGGSAEMQLAYSTAQVDRAVCKLATLALWQIKLSHPSK